MRRTWYEAHIAIRLAIGDGGAYVSGGEAGSSGSRRRDAHRTRKTVVLLLEEQTAAWIRHSKRAVLKRDSPGSARGRDQYSS